MGGRYSRLGAVVVGAGVVVLGGTGKQQTPMTPVKAFWQF